MAIIRFSTLVNNQTLAFNPASDVLFFDDPQINAGSIVYRFSGTDTIAFTVQGKTIHYLPGTVSLSQINSSNITFANGSLFVIGDAAANILVGTNNGDYFIGLGDADTMRGGAGADTYMVDNAGDVVDETTMLGDVAALTYGPMLVSASITDGYGNGLSYSSSLSQDGRYALFSSSVNNLTFGDTNDASDVFIRDMLTGTTQRVSTTSSGIQANTLSAVTFVKALSADGRFVAFSSDANNLVSVDSNAATDIFVKDMQTGTVQRASVNAAGVEANNASTNATISNDGRYVVFESDADNLVSDDTNLSKDIFIKDLQTGTVQRVSVASSGIEANANSFIDAISADNTLIVFESYADNLVADDINGAFDIFIKNTQTGQLQRVSTTSNGAEAIDGDSKNGRLSADGRFMVFESTATNLVADDTNYSSDIFVKDLQTGAVERVSATVTSAEVSGSSNYAAISADGRYVAFQSDAADLVDGDTNGYIDIFIKDLQTGVVKRLSLDPDGNQSLGGDSYSPAFSADGRFLTFMSDATNLVANDLNEATDVFQIANPFITNLVNPYLLNADPSVDKVLSSVDYILGKNVENLALTGTAVMGTGNDLSNTIIGNTENNLINGGDGNDILSGGSGHDVLNGDKGNDTLNGNDGNDTLNGGVGSDAMVGGLGDDVYYIDELTDVITETHDQGIDLVNISIATVGGTYFLAANVENATLVNAVTYNLTGNGLNNQLIGNEAANVLKGGGGDDFLVGGEGAGKDSLYGGDGNDTLVGEGDVLVGEAGIDVFYAGAGSVIVDQEEGENIYLAGSVNASSAGASLNATLGGAGISVSLGGGASVNVQNGLTALGNANYIFADGSSIKHSDLLGNNLNSVVNLESAAAMIFGGKLDDTLTALGTTNSTLFGGLGNDSLAGSAGLDTLMGGMGNDTISGGSGADNVDGGQGNDVISGDAGDDILEGGDGIDTMMGGLGNDTYVVDTLSDVITENAGEGTDTVQSSITYSLASLSNVENVVLTGISNIDATDNGLDNVLTGNSGNNNLIAGVGNDTLNGGAGIDTMMGGVGDDTYIVDGTSDVFTENTGEGSDTVQIGYNNDTGITVNLAAGTGIFTNIESITLNNTGLFNLTGDGSNNALTGNASANILNGGSGNDTLNGGVGIDTLIGGVGNDTYIVDTTTDVITENGNEGTDTVQSSITYSLASLSNVENLTLTGTAAINGTGDIQNNVITGNSAANILEGGDGIDTMMGGLGNDTYVVDTLSDVITENAGEGTDTVQSSITYSLASLSNVENVVLTGISNIDATDNGLDNVLTGNSGNNNLIAGVGNDTLNGGAGIDTMMGGVGDDTYIVDGTSDVFTENTGEGSDTVQIGYNNDTGITVNLAAGTGIFTNIESITLNNTGLFNLTGDGSNNALTGNASANILNGGSGNDTLNGGVGIDTLIGGVGNDTYIVDTTTDVITENGNEGTDTVQSSITYSLASLSNVENLTLTGTAAINGTGDIQNNVITGNSAANILEGGDGIDTIMGGLGNDTYVVDAYDYVIEASDAGVDTIQTSTTFTLSDNFENLTLIGSSGYYGTGNALNNILIGNSGTNRLAGLEGNDTLDGQAENDTLWGGLGNDTYKFGLGYGQDKAYDYVYDTYNFDDTNYDDDLASYIFRTTPGNLDTILMGSGILPSQIVVDFVDADVRLTVAGTTDSITLQSWVHSGIAGGIYDQSLTIEQVIFADGTVWDLASQFSFTFATTELADTIGGTVLNDAINGLGGNDILYGYGGADTLNGGVGNDTLYGGLGDDVLDGGAGNDSLNGSDGTNTYIFARGYGNDMIRLGYQHTKEVTDIVQLGADITPADIILSRVIPGQNTLTELKLSIAGTTDSVRLLNYFQSEWYDFPDNPNGKINHSIIRFADGTEWTYEYVKSLILATDANDALDGSISADIIHGLLGNDTIYGDSGNDQLFGDKGNDKIFGNSGNDTLDGGAGNDTLRGGQGSDTYLFGRGSGQDGIYSTNPSIGDVDIIQLGENISTSDVIVRDIGFSGDNDLLEDFTLSIVGTTDKLTVDTFFSNSNLNNVIRFADGTTWNLAELKVRALIPTEGVDRIYGFSTNDVISGLGGSDSIYGRAGNDTIQGGRGADYINGDGGNDVLDGGAGNDTIYGGDGGNSNEYYGTDTFHFGRGYGQDLIYSGDYRGSSTVTPINTDVIKLGAGISTSDIIVGNNSSNGLVLIIKGTTDVLTVYGYFSTTTANAYRLNSIQFDDGTTWDYSTVLSKVVSLPYLKAFYSTGTTGADFMMGEGTLDGGDGADTIIGDSGQNSLIGGLGDDLISGGGGFDTIDGGAGNDIIFGGTDEYYDPNKSSDRLTGGLGSDTYLFGYDSGWEFIYDTGDKTDTDIVQFAMKSTDITALLRVGNDLVIQSGAGDQLTIIYQLSSDHDNYGLGVEQLQFSDGVTWTQVDILSYINTGGITSNVAPTGTDKTVTINEDIAYTLSAADFGFSDVNVGDSLSAVRIDKLPIVGSLTLGGVGISVGQVVAAASITSLVFKPVANANGNAYANFTFSVKDNKGAFDAAPNTLTFNVTAVNDAPIVATAITAQTALEDTPFSFTVPANAFSDADAGDTLSYTTTLSDGSALPGWLAFDPATHSFSGTPANGDVGSLDVKITATDSLNVSISDTFRITVANVNDAPTAVNQTITVLENTSYTLTAGNFGFSDVDTGDSLQAVSLDSLPGAGTLALNGVALTLSQDISIANLAVGKLKFTPTANTGGSNYSNVAFKVSDGLAFSGSYTVTINVTYNFPGTAKDDVLLGTNDNDYLRGYAGNDRLQGLDGNDTLDGGKDSDAMDGGAGNDTYYVDHAGDVIVEVAGGGTDRVISTLDYSLLGTELENLTLSGIVALNGTGNSFNNSLTGNALDNVLMGLEGNDWLSGGLGNDTLNGGNGTDTVSYAYLTDAVKSVTVALDETGNGMAMVTGGETDTLTGIENLTGGAGNDTLTGNSATNVLNGGLGADTLTGGAGNDYYYVDNPGDVIVEAAGAGTDTVNSTLDYSLLGTELENLTLSGIVALNGTGNNFNNSLSGNALDNVLMGLDGNDVLNGGLGADTLIGGAGNDYYYVDNASDVIVEAAGAGTDTVNSTLDYSLLGTELDNLTLSGIVALNGTGNSFNNSLTGNALDNILMGLEGNDWLSGGLGNDTLDGGNGTDTVSYAYLTDAVKSVTVALDETGNGMAMVTGGETDTLTGIESLTGGAGNDTLTGNSANNVLNGALGADTLTGGAGNDYYYVDNAGDVIVEAAGAGTDTVNSALDYSLLGTELENLTLSGIVALNGTGNNFNNSLTGNALDNVLMGLEGNDALNGGLGNDTLNGGNGTDTVSYAYLTDAVKSVTVALDETGNGIAMVTGGETDTLIGIENLTGGAGNDTLTGNSGNNVLNGALGADTLTGGAGNDYYYVDNAGDVIVEAAGAGTDTVNSTLDYSLLGTELENLTLSGIVALNGTGNNFNNSLSGNALDNVLMGLDGNDVLNGGLGADTLIGGAGNDYYYVDNASDVIVEAAGAGTDTVNSTLDYSLLGTELENLTLSGIVALNGTGNNFNNSLSGNALDNVLMGLDGNDVLNGGLGADTLIGGAGNDYYYVDNAGEVIVEAAGAGTDTVNSTLDYSLLGTELDNLTLSGIVALNGTGNSFNNSLTGNALDNVLMGLEGNDWLSGGLGNDTLDGGNGTDTVSYAYLTDAVKSVTVTLDEAGNGIAMVTGGETDTLTGIENLTGGAGNDTLTGNSANNVLNGALGADTLIGGAGNDYYYVDNAGEVIVEAAGAGTDTVNSTLDYSLLGTELDNLTLSGIVALNGTGNSFNNSLTGNALDNVLMGLEGNDWLSGGLGNDTLDGGSGTDTVSYAYLTDAVKSVTVALDEAGNGMAMVTGGETDTLTGIENLTGGAGNDTLTGNSGNNVLNGGPGADTLTGGAGNDYYYLDNASDVIVEAAGAGTDTVNSALDYSLLGTELDNLTLSGIVALNGTGNSFNNSLTGNALDNVLMGLEGNDRLSGGEGADLFSGGLGKDTYLLKESVAATDTLKIAAGDSLVTSFDVASDFKLGVGGNPGAAGVDRLDLASTSIAANVSHADGKDFGKVGSHSISNGLISFANISGGTPLDLTGANLTNAIHYLQEAITGDNTVAFVADNNTYVFQDGGVTDTLVQLTGVSASGISSDGFDQWSVWLT